MRPNKAFYGLKQSGRAWYQLLSSTGRVRFRAMIDRSLCVRPRAACEVVAMIVLHINGIKIAAAEEMTEATVSALDQIFSTKHLGGVE